MEEYRWTGGVRRRCDQKRRQQANLPAAHGKATKMATLLQRSEDDEIAARLRTGSAAMQSGVASAEGYSEDACIAPRQTGCP